jgi:RNA polymerase sigma factor FliA
MPHGGAAPGVEQYLPLVRKIAHRVKRSLGSASIEVDDLVSYGVTGLLEAQKRFDPRYGVAFTSFAYHRVEGAIYDGLRRMGALPRTYYASLRTSEYLENAVERAAGGDGKRTSLAALREIARVLRGAAAVAIAAGALQEDPADPADEAAARRELAVKVRAAIAALPERERTIVERHYYQDQTLLEAGAELGVTKSWASRLHARAVDLLREKLKDV